MSYIQNPDTKNKQKDHNRLGYSSFSHTGSAGTSRSSIGSRRSSSMSRPHMRIPTVLDSIGKSTNRCGKKKKIIIHKQIINPKTAIIRAVTQKVLPKGKSSEKTQPFSMSAREIMK